MPKFSSETDELPSVNVTWSEQECLLELSGRMSRRLLGHARDLVYARIKPASCLTVRLRNTVLTRDLMSMLIGARRYLARSGGTLRIEDPVAALPLHVLTDAQMRSMRRSG
jgi:hypothetical protein